MRRLSALAAALALGLHPALVAPAQVPAYYGASAPADWATMDLRDGDLVFRAGVDLAARLILSQGDGTVFSHVGMIVVQDGEPHVLHAVPEEQGSPGGVMLEPLREFSAPGRASHVAAYRIEAADGAAREAMRIYALTQLGKPFDAEFSMVSDHSLYCTELVLKAMKAAGLQAGKLVPPLHVMTVQEPVFAPDALRRSPGLVALRSEARQVVFSKSSD